MSVARFPTIHQVLPFFVLFLANLNAIVGCIDLDAEPDFDELQCSSEIPEEILRAVEAARQKLIKYLHITRSSSIFWIATSEAFYFAYTIDLTLLYPI